MDRRYDFTNDYIGLSQETLNEHLAAITTQLREYDGGDLNTIVRLKERIKYLKTITKTEGIEDYGSWDDIFTFQSRQDGANY